MKKYKIYINEQGLELFSVVNSERQAGFILKKLDERGVYGKVIEHDTDIKSDNPCTYKIRMKYLKK